LAKVAQLLSPKTLFILLPSIISLSGLILVMNLCYRDYQDLKNMEQAKTSNSGVSLNNLSSREQPIRSNDTATKRKQSALLFGQHLLQTAEPIGKSPPDTRLDLILQGTFTHTEEKKASALIAHNNQSSKNYLMGDEITPGVKLVAIHPGKVILRRNGQDESLKMPILKGETQFRQQTFRPSSDPLTPKYSMARNINQNSVNIQQRLKQARTQAKVNLVNNEELD